GIEGIANATCGVERAQLFDKLVVNIVFHEKSASSTAALPLVEIEGEVSTGDGGIQVGVSEYHVGALAAQLEREPLHRLGGFALDDLGRGQLTGEGNLVDTRVAHECRTGSGAKTGYHVN